MTTYKMTTEHISALLMRKGDLVIRLETAEGSERKGIINEINTIDEILLKEFC